MKYLALAMTAFFSISAAAQNYKPNLPIETVSSEMSSIEKKVRDAAVKITVDKDENTMRQIAKGAD